MPEEKKDILWSYENKAIELGITPEHIELLDISSMDKNLVKGEAFMIELMGNEKIIHFRVGGKTIICRIDPHCMVEKGKKTSFVFNLHFCHFFNVSTKKNIGFENI